MCHLKLYIIKCLLKDINISNLGIVQVQVLKVTWRMVERFANMIGRTALGVTCPIPRVAKRDIGFQILIPDQFRSPIELKCGQVFHANHAGESTSDSFWLPGLTRTGNLK